MKRTLSKCRGCEKSIAFLKTSKGSGMPVNAESLSEEDINYYLAGGEVLFDSKTMVSHFSDCPKSKEFRRVKKDGVNVRE